MANLWLELGYHNIDDMLYSYMQVVRNSNRNHRVATSVPGLNTTSEVHFTALTILKFDFLL